MGRRRRIRFTSTWWNSSKQLGLGVYLWWGKTDIQIEVQFIIWYFSADWIYRT